MPKNPNIHRSLSTLEEKVITILGNHYQSSVLAKKALTDEVLFALSDVGWDQHFVGGVFAYDDDVLKMGLAEVLAEIPRLNQSLGKAEKLNKDVQSIMLAALAITMQRNILERWDVVEDVLAQRAKRPTVRR